MATVSPDLQQFLLDGHSYPRGVERGHVVGRVQQEGQLRVEQQGQVGPKEGGGGRGQGGNNVHQKLLV